LMREKRNEEAAEARGDLSLGEAKGQDRQRRKAISAIIEGRAAEEEGGVV
jgi:hypothetical protein